MNRIGTTLTAALLAAVSVVATADPVASAHRRDATETGGDAEAAAAAKRGIEAMSALQTRLAGRLMAEMARGGPVAAVGVCRDEAQQLTASVSAELGVEIGRTSHRLRNPLNVARPWVVPLLPAYAGRRAEDAGMRIVDLGDRVGVVKPLATQPLCLNCHGDRDAMAPEIREMIAKAYPSDEATGFALGEVRGLIWAEVPKAGLGGND
ncbi:MAG: DUF3365 domain-containing protein [Gammaproteobacteria bacterium]|nr:DUF3365 domain-containing protein [Gammaproteobacteria bacterium]